jgi:hypothetical protein
VDDPSPPSPPKRGGSDVDGLQVKPVLEPAVAEAPSAEAAEVALGQSPAGKDANAALRALAHTARSFILYDAANERIRGFLEDVRVKIEHYLATHGEMHLEVRPWDIVLGSEVVYSDKDRERSLAFRLYRDGVRRLVIRPELEWNEIIVLIGILSVRYKGVRTQEDDVVTLLWRADFKHIEIGAVEGLVASEADDSDMQVPEGSLTGPRNAMQAMIFSAPYRFDYPWPSYAERAAIEHRQVPPSLLLRISEEDGTEALPRQCVQLAKELLAGLVDPLDPLVLDDVTPVLREIRSFLVGDNFLDALLEVVHTVQRMGPPDEKTQKELLAACADEDVVRRFILTLTPDELAAPPALLELMTTAVGDHLGTLLDLFSSSLHHRSSPLVRQLLETQMHGQAARVAERLHALGGHAAIDLFRVMVKADPAGAVDAAVGLLGTTEEDLQLESLRLLENTSYGAKIGRALVGALGAGSSGVRLRALGILARQRESRAFDPLVEKVRRGATGELTVAEARVAGEALAWLDPERARALFKEWIRPPGLLSRLAPGQTILRWAAVSGLAHLPGPDSEELLEWLAHHTSDDLSRQAEATLAQLRHAKEGQPRA